MPDTTLIANGTVVTAEGEFAGDVLIEGETIAAVGRIAAPEGAEVVDASGCLVDFAIQREPDNLRSALDEWQGRADGAAHVDYGFHMAITNTNEAVLDDMPAMTEAGVSSFKLFMAYKGELMTRDDALMATMDRARELGGLI